MLILNTCSFQKRMLSNFTWVDSLTNRSVYMTEFNAKKATVFRVVTFWNQALTQI